jgi:hypothetical protein
VAESQTIIQELKVVGEKIWVRLALPDQLNPPAGRYLQAWELQNTDLLATTLFPVGFIRGWFASSDGIPPLWRAGTALRIKSPLGNGFQLLSGIQRLGLLDLTDSQAAFLIPAIPQALESNAAVSVCSLGMSESLPEVVELLPLSAQLDLISWADCLLISLFPNSLVSAFGPLRKELSRLGLAAQILVIAAMPCGGIAECGLCAIDGTKRVLLACKDGPVFDFRDLSQ